MTWTIMIDQRTKAGSTQRYGPFCSVDESLCGAIEDALSLAGLDMAREGQYQITAVPEKGEL